MFRPQCKLNTGEPDEFAGFEGGKNNFTPNIKFRFVTNKGRSLHLSGAEQAPARHTPVVPSKDPPFEHISVPSACASAVRAQAPSVRTAGSQGSAPLPTGKKG